MNRRREVIKDCLKKNKLAIILFVLMSVLDMVVFYLYDVLLEPLVYATLLVFVFLIIYLVVEMFLENHAAKQRARNMANILVTGTDGIDLSTLRDEDYADMIETLSQEVNRLKTDYAEKALADESYYTAWVHQIKTPIAVMKLQLTEDSDAHRILSSELFRIEQYVEMVLDYVRLDSDSNDLVIQEYALDEIIREVLRKYATQFVLRKLKLTYEGTTQKVVTDRKWLGFMLEQLISNAIKYTPQGGISILVEGNRIKVTDTGIGIASEDIPRIFEKGFTGNNGRIGEKSSGLGLFLTKKAAGLLAAKLSCESEVGVGTTFTIELPKENGLVNPS